MPYKDIEEKRAYQREYMQRPEVKAKQKAYKNRPEVKARNNKLKRANINATPYKFVRNKVLSQRASAKARGLVWELDIDATIAKILRQGRCKLSGDKFVYKQGKGRENRNPYAPSIDRIDNRKGYIPGNVMFINWENNWAKGDKSLYRYKRMCAKVAKVAL